MFCSNCGKPTRPGENFCSGCGVRLVYPIAKPAVPVNSVAPVSAVPAPVVLQPIALPTPPAPPAVPPKKASHRAPILILVALSIIGLLTFFAIPVGGQPANDILPTESGYLTNRNGALTFRPELYEGGPELKVPQRVGGKTVTAIDDDCFFGCDDLETVILPDSLETIGERAFSCCSNLRGIFIPEGVTEIRQQAFSYCQDLEAISIPSTVNTIEEDVFEGCSSLKHIFFSGTKDQWRDAFRGDLSWDTTVYCQDGEI